MGLSTAVPNYFNVSILILIILASILYLIPIVYVPRLQNHDTIYTANFCLTVIFISIYSIVYYLMFENAYYFLFSSPTCTFMYYTEQMLSCQVAYAFSILSINRYLHVVYPTTRYPKWKKRLRAILCAQWLIGMILPLPIFARNLPYCAVQLWVFMLTTIVSTVIPTLACFIIHLFIFIHARSSSRRVHAELFAVQGSVTGNLRRDNSVLRQAVVVYCIYLLGNTPSLLLTVIDDKRRVDAAVYATLQLLGSASLLAIMIYLILTNDEVRDYFKQKIRLRLQR